MVSNASQDRSEMPLGQRTEDKKQTEEHKRRLREQKKKEEEMKRHQKINQHRILCYRLACAAKEIFSIAQMRQIAW